MELISSGKNGGLGKGHIKIVRAMLLRSQRNAHFEYRGTPIACEKAGTMKQ